MHLSDLVAEPERIMYTVKWVYLCEFFSILCPCFGRVSFALLLLSIIPPNTSRRVFLWCIIAVQVVVDVGTVIISFSQCRPIEGFWDQSIESDCWPPYVQQYTGFTQGCNETPILVFEAISCPALQVLTKRQSQRCVLWSILFSLFFHLQCSGT